jgi:ankyrin repeat protein
MQEPELVTAAGNGDSGAVARLLDAKVDPNARGIGGESALMRATRRGALDVIESLLARGAEVNAKSDAGNTALMFAAARGHLAVVRLLLQRGAARDHCNKFGLGPRDWAKWPANSGEIQTLLES